ncbi:MULTISPECIES: rod-binding protein [unclassified Ruegeria]|uniref:rod-binding protein n=1 Tax=unclassified Ruegeria TaxID=2625375 RepID=UPI001489D0C9|nr:MULTISPECIES: rod-binding protein [unclassified Ruegeria]
MKIPMTIQAHQHSATQSPLQQAAVELEATFLAEMLKSAGLGTTPESFGGGAGEDQFASLLVQHQARQLAQSGGIGLSEVLFEAMKEKHDVE